MPGLTTQQAVEAINEFVCLTSGDEEITWPFGLDENISYDGNRLKTAIRHANRKVLESLAKVGAMAAVKTLRSSPGLEALYQLHWSVPAGAEKKWPACSATS